ncbi:MAG: hypothetical protein U1F76_27565 [Candidatus Competibacteraceae bacterium]
MTHSISILDIAHEIRPLLPELLAEEAEAVDQALAGLLERAESGEDVNYDIRVLLGKYEATDRWKRKRLKGNRYEASDEKYMPLAGDLAETPDAVEYACPVPGCSSPHWFPVDAGDIIPSCEIHGNKFEPVSNA